jgi:large subunit ribosomal protein L25
MSIAFELDASIRQDLGKGASRRLRREAQVPAIIYGAGKEATPLLLDHNKVLVALQKEGFYTHILTLNVNSKPEKVILKAMQRHPYKPVIMHMDFLRISADEKLKMHVPLHFVGAETSPGVKAGGLVSHLLSDIEISCLPANLPEFLEVDISTLEMDKLLHLSEMKLPKGVEIVALSHDQDLPVVSIHMPHVEAEPEVAVAATPDAAAVPASAQKEPEAEKKDDKK